MDYQTMDTSLAYDTVKNGILWATNEIRDRGSFTYTVGKVFRLDEAASS